MNPTLKPRVNVLKGQIACDDNATDTASIYPFYLDSSEITDADSIFSDSSDISSTDLSIFDSSDASSIMDSSVFIDCSI